MGSPRVWSGRCFAGPAQMVAGLMEYTEAEREVGRGDRVPGEVSTEPATAGKAGDRPKGVPLAQQERAHSPPCLPGDGLGRGEGQVRQV
jgi:hypothetical protein